MKQELKEYIKRCIILEQHANSNIIKDIVKKFPSNYVTPPLGWIAAPPRGALADNKRDAFWKRYDIDEALRKQLNSSYAYRKITPWYPEFWVVTQELREYLKPELQSVELLLIERDKVSALKISDVSSALEIAENIEEFIEMVKTLR